MKRLLAITLCATALVGCRATQTESAPIEEPALDLISSIVEQHERVGAESWAGFGGFRREVDSSLSMYVELARDQMTGESFVHRLSPEETEQIEGLLFDERTCTHDDWVVYVADERNLWVLISPTYEHRAPRPPRPWAKSREFLGRPLSRDRRGVVFIHRSQFERS
ncbi:MAG: hypothetical protein AAF517_22720 [Planctomycetota bacterium]